ncbi:unnamed protein product [Brassica rapa]|uniref:Uncharacterized protein n=1 Tax=Brassica campestris TaxID=3711 RepID=A0A8D9HCF7_BRACM|nr:unnamed protein product [Brassica rapa]
MKLAQFAERRVRSIGPTRRWLSWPWLIQLLRRIGGAGLVVPMLGNCSLDGLNGPLSISDHVLPSCFDPKSLETSDGQTVIKTELVAHSVDPKKADVYWMITCGHVIPQPDSWQDLKLNNDRTLCLEDQHPSSVSQGSTHRQIHSPRWTILLGPLSPGTSSSCSGLQLLLTSA